MSPMEITLLIIGVVIFLVSFLIKDSEEKSEEDIELQKEEIRNLLSKEIAGMNLKVREATDSSIEYAMVKAERSLEKISNEKIMAVNEYSNTILEDINKSHKEVMFLYDMLNDKQIDLKNTVREASAVAKEVEEENIKAYSPAKVNVSTSEDDFKGIEFLEAQINEREAVNVQRTEEADSKKNNNDMIIKLHEEGKSMVEIAKELNLGVGEVTLVIDLYER